MVAEMITQAVPEGREAVLALVLDGLGSPHSRRVYRRALEGFLDWQEATRRPISKALVLAYRAELLASGLAPGTVNLALSAIRKLAIETVDAGYLRPEVGDAIARAPGVKRAGVRTGNWLTRDQAQALLDAPSSLSGKGVRDRAILALLLGGGLRRSEVAGLRFEDIAQRDGRWVIIDLMGKASRVRTVPIPSWVKVSIDGWWECLFVPWAGRMFWSMQKGGLLPKAEGLTAQAVHDVVRSYAKTLGLGRLSPHDLRRTWAKLAYAGGAPLDQIQLSLGHASIQTTERYLGTRQDLRDAPCDHLKIGT